MFSVVEFKEGDGGGIALINAKWLTPRKKEVYWPPIKDTSKFNKLINEVNQNIDSENWKLYKIERIFGEADDFETGNELIKKFMISSDIQTDVEQECEDKTKKRHRVRPLRYSSSDSEEETQNKRAYYGAIKIKKPPRLDFLSTAEGTPKSSCSNQSASFSGTSCTTNYAKPTDYDTPNSQVDDTVEGGFQEKGQGYKHLLAQIIKVQEQNKLIINLLNSKISNNNVKEKGLPDDFPVCLPLDTLENLNILEDFLQIESNHNTLVRHLSFDGPSDLRSKTNRVLRSVLTNTLACDFNFAGRKRKDHTEKKAFSQLKLCRVIVDVVNGKKNEFDVESIESSIKLWLKHAPGRVVKMKNNN